jgi:hypothetical protein
MTRITPLFLLFAALGTGCSWSGSEAAGAARIMTRRAPVLVKRLPEPSPVPAQAASPPVMEQSPGEPLPLKKPEKVSAALAARAGSILLDNWNAPFGTVIPFTEGGRSYLARIERHDNPENNPLRPPGKHKGITVYER